jgi:hypothetical protein
VHDGERFWWAEALFSLVCSVAGVIVPYLLLSNAPFGSPYAPASDNWQ